MYGSQMQGLYEIEKALGKVHPSRPAIGSSALESGSGALSQHLFDA